jgi:alkanesulfonate monooxygenase SsuD/methylene tetrahydromethanopterin reductase-like flavin-dependent oxidoreductase (luciferase family)
VIVGGGGPRRTPALAARFAAEYNAAFPELDEIPTLFGRVRDAAYDAGRDPDDLVYSAALVLCVGKDEAEFRRRAEAIGRDPEELRGHGIAGTVDDAVDVIGRVREAGGSRVYLQTLDLHDLDHLELVAQEVAPRL